MEYLKFKLAQFFQNPIANTCVWLFERARVLFNFFAPLNPKHRQAKQITIVESPSEVKLFSNETDTKLVNSEENNKQCKLKGVVKWFSVEKGYGFVNFNDKDIYFNVRGVQGAVIPRMGDSVCFSIAKAAKGEKAVDVEKIDTSFDSIYQENKYIDHRVTCPNCGKKITPRLITYRGEPSKSLCPFCGGTVSDFSDNSFGKSLAIFLVIVVFVAFVFGVITQ